MKQLPSFLKRNCIWILLLVLIMVIQIVSFSLTHMRLDDVIYFVCIDLAIIFVFLAIAFFRYCAKIKSLERMTQEAVSDTIGFPEAYDAVEKCYQELVENINLHQKLVVAKSERQQFDMQEYYSMWVHQIKTPIAAMKLLLQVQKEKLENENDIPEDYVFAQMKFLSDMEDELFHIEEYVQMALQYQRLYSVSNDFVLKKTSLDGIVRETIRKYAKIMIRRRIPICYMGTDTQITTDEKWLAFALEQIISNAIKYTKEGSITIDVVQEGNHRFLRVADQGIGIKKEDLPRVFEKGYTGYNGHTNKYSTGIGLYLSKQMLEKLGHSIRIESQIGVGTTVWIGFTLQ